MPNSKIKASQVRAMLYKLRQTWGDKYHVFTDQKLFQLDNKIKSIDHAWPVVAPKERPNSQTPKILVNPAFVGKVSNAGQTINIEDLNILTLRWRQPRTRPRECEQNCCRRRRSCWP